MSEIIRTQNPMSSTQNGNHTQTNSVVGQSMSNREMAEVQAQVVMAKQFPRDIVHATDRIINECMRKSLAESAVYSYPKGGMSVQGPSIRLAETIARNWGNIDFGIREVEQSNGESTVVAYAWDLETNTKQTKLFKVRHERKARGQINKLDDPRDIYEMVANQGARRVRACILGIIPSDVIDTALDQCSQTLMATADVTKEGIKKLLDAFAEFGVTKEHIEKNIGCRIEAVKPAQVVKLRTIFTSLKDGMSKNWDWFEIEKPKQFEPEKVKSDIL